MESIVISSDSEENESCLSPSPKRVCKEAKPASIVDEDEDPLIFNVTPLGLASISVCSSPEKPVTSKGNSSTVDQIDITHLEDINLHQYDYHTSPMRLSASKQGSNLKQHDTVDLIDDVALLLVKKELDLFNAPDTNIAVPKPLDVDEHQLIPESIEGTQIMRKESIGLISRDDKSSQNAAELLDDEKACGSDANTCPEDGKTHTAHDQSEDGNKKIAIEVYDDVSDMISSKSNNFPDPLHVPCSGTEQSEDVEMAVVSTAQPRCYMDVTIVESVEASLQMSTAGSSLTIHSSGHTDVQSVDSTTISTTEITNNGSQASQQLQIDVEAGCLSSDILLEIRQLTPSPQSDDGVPGNANRELSSERTREVDDAEVVITNTVAPVAEDVTEIEDDGSNNNPQIDSSLPIDNFVPVEVAFASKEYQPADGNFLKGCKWSPDGMCVLTASNDNRLRLYNLPTSLYNDTGRESEEKDGAKEMVPALQMSEGETIYDYDWYPEMSSYEAASCCLISTSRDHPIHLWDAYDGRLRCSYRAFNHLDEIVAANSLCFSPDGSKIYSGFCKVLRVFTTSRPGRECTELSLCSKGRKKVTHQSGIISAIACTPEHGGLYALGSFSKSVGVYSGDDHSAVFVNTSHVGGVTQLKFSPDGYFLYSGGRKDPNIICWDLRCPGHILFSVPRTVTTNQRVQFDLTSDGSHLITGETDGRIRIYDVRQTLATEDFESIPEPKLVVGMTMHKDAVNGVSLHPTLPLLATSSGQRHFRLPDLIPDDTDIGVDDDPSDIENSVKIWRYA